MSNVNLQNLIDRAGKMALHNIWGENSYKINKAILKRDTNNCVAYTRLAEYYRLDHNIEAVENEFKELRMNTKSGKVGENKT